MVAQLPMASKNSISHVKKNKTFYLRGDRKFPHSVLCMKMQLANFCK